MGQGSFWPLFDLVWSTAMGQGSFWPLFDLVWSTAMGQGSFWPLFDLVVRTPRLEMRLPREDEFEALIKLADRGVHHPETMPFFVAWTDLEPTERARSTAQWLWGNGANWTPDKWTFTAAGFVDGLPIGVPDLSAEHFRAVRSVETGSWPGRAHQGQGLGREMREAVLHLAFAGLDAGEGPQRGVRGQPGLHRHLAHGGLRGQRRGPREATGRLAAHRPFPPEPGGLGAAPARRHRDRRAGGVFGPVRRPVDA
jgi:RimJ/RimL family protein N-acetyltransferase